MLYYVIYYWIIGGGTFNSFCFIYLSLTIFGSQVLRKPGQTVNSYQILIAFCIPYVIICMFDIMGEVFPIINFKISRFQPLNCGTDVIPV